MRSTETTERTNRAAGSTFTQEPVQDIELLLHVKRPATNLAYSWLTHDLAALGWLKDRAYLSD